MLVEAQGGRGQSRGSCHVQSGSQVKLWEAVRQGRGQRVIRTAGSRLGKGMGRSQGNCSHENGKGRNLQHTGESESVEKEAKENKANEGERKQGLGEGLSYCRYWQ